MGGGEVSGGAGAASRFSVDDPVADSTMGYRKIAVWKVVALARAIIIAGVRFGVEDERHEAEQVDDFGKYTRFLQNRGPLCGLRSEDFVDCVRTTRDDSKCHAGHVNLRRSVGERISNMQESLIRVPVHGVGDHRWRE